MNKSGQSFPRLAYGGQVASSGRIALMPSETIPLEEHQSIFGSPEPYFYKYHHLVRQLSESDILGRGGGAFPLSRKIASYERFGKNLIVVANGSEGEFLSRKDEALLRRLPHLVLDGLSILATALDATKAYLHIDFSKEELRRIVQAAIIARRKIDPLTIDVSTTMSGVGYVAGNESAVISAINRQGGRPIYLPDRPIVRGVKKRPTMIVNVETLAQLALMTRFGSEWFSSVGEEGDTGTRLMTVSLPSGSSTVIEIVVGTKFSEIVRAFGVSREQISCGLVGGYYGQLVDAEKLWLLRASQPHLKAAGLSFGAGVLALAVGCPISLTAKIIGYLSGESAGQCGPCYLGLPELFKVWQGVAEGRISSGSYLRIEELCEEIAGRGGCAMPDGAVMLSRMSLSRFNSEILSHQGGRCSYAPGNEYLVPSGAVTAKR